MAMNGQAYIRISTQVYVFDEDNRRLFEALTEIKRKQSYGPSPDRSGILLQHTFTQKITSQEYIDMRPVNSLLGLVGTGISSKN